MTIRRRPRECFHKRGGVDLLGCLAEAYSYPTTTHNPADGSFAAMPCQTAAKTNYLNQRFLSY
ncbi:hypothetical protein LPUS_07389 [Lasallia pustulata]|uniref:Uncharacterized protein n=1 Tax=Lasallia pustulata TaxID=136370 RepID=A0A1W5D364_9LECA|nr:hypothetical protein LPUS_07389 [Lasallia pustulata]